MPKETRIGQHASVKVDLTGLNNLIKTMDSPYVVRVGILGEKPRSKTNASEKDQKDPPTNAEIGLAHEKGVKSRNLPRRSWLQTPLEDHLPEYFLKEGPSAMVAMIQGKALQVYTLLAAKCEDIIQVGFDTGGYGKWQALKEATIARKKSSAILIDTAQLRKSVTSVVVTK